MEWMLRGRTWELRSFDYECKANVSHCSSHTSVCTRITHEPAVVGKRRQPYPRTTSRPNASVPYTLKTICGHPNCGRVIHIKDLSGSSTLAKLIFTKHISRLERYINWEIPYARFAFQTQ